MGKRKFEHALQSFRREGFPANIPILIGRVRADNQEIRISLELAMPCPGWQDDNIARIYLEFMAVLPTQDEPGPPTGETKHFVCCRMVVMEIVNAIPPFGRPAVPGKQILKCGGRIGAAGCHCRPIKQDRQPLVVRNPAVAFEPKHLGL